MTNTKNSDQDCSTSDERLCFVAMPFEEPYFTLFREVLEPTISRRGLKAARTDHIDRAGSILADIFFSIAASSVVVADVSDWNPNVVYEVGVAHALGKPTLLITSDSTKIPFDLQHLRYLSYDLARQNWQLSLKQRLSRAIRKTLEDPEASLALPTDLGPMRPTRIEAALAQQINLQKAVLARIGEPEDRWRSGLFAAWRYGYPPWDPPEVFSDPKVRRLLRQLDVHLASKLRSHSEGGPRETNTNKTVRAKSSKKLERTKKGKTRKNTNRTTDPPAGVVDISSRRRRNQ